VDALVASPDGSGVYVGGQFKNVNAAPQAHLVHLLANGSTDAGFDATANGPIQALALTGNRLFVGGQFTAIASTPRDDLAELDATTGVPAASFNLPLSGPVGNGGYMGVHALRISPDGTRLLVAHTAQFVGGLERFGVALIDIDEPVAAVDPWYTTFWKDNLPNSGGTVRVTDAAWGPDGSWFVTSNTGGDKPPANDSVQRFDVNVPLPAAVTWVDRQFDSSYSITTDANGTVYVGGHFRYTDAPGSDVPFPGDPNTNYGWGPAGGARVLGAQVVYRYHVDALDPATGRALNWYSSADGQHGVTALLVAGGKLLIGDDGQHVDGAATGRSGMAALYSTTYDTTVPHSVVAQPVLGSNQNIGAIPISGTSTSPTGVKKVQVEIKDVVAGTWLQADGVSWGPFYGFTATLTTPGATSTAWSLSTVNLPKAGSFTMLVQTTDKSGAKEPVKASVPFFTNDPTDPGPKVAWVSPTSGEQDFTSNTVTVSGTSSSPFGVAAVQLSFYNTDLGGYLNPDWSVGDFSAFSANLASPGGTATTWSLSVQLPDGNWTAMATGLDSAGGADPRGFAQKFLMAPTSPTPVVAMDSPVAKQLVAPTFTVSGTASSLAGISKVLVRIADNRFALGPQIAGTFGPAAWRPATLLSPGATTTSWSIDVPSVPYGSYSVSAEAVDPNGIVTPSAQRPAALVYQWPVGATTEPATVLSTPASTSFGSLAAAMAGTASYNGGVAAVQLVVQNTQLGWYLQPDGSTGSLPGYLPTTLASPGATSTAWTSTVNLPQNGSYQVDAIAVGSDGNVDSTATGSRTTYKVFPGDATPTTQLNNPLAGAIIKGTGGVVTIGGRAFDDNSIAAVQLMIANPGSTVGITATGTVGKPAWVNAYVTNPLGGPATNWNYSTVALPAGTYKITARATDNVGQLDAAPPSVTITLKIP
jgi:trimeric autotransporter adhesin